MSLHCSFFSWENVLAHLLLIKITKDAFVSSPKKRKAFHQKRKINKNSLYVQAMMILIQGTTSRNRVAAPWNYTKVIQHVFNICAIWQFILQEVHGKYHNEKCICNSCLLLTMTSS